MTRIVAYAGVTVPLVALGVGLLLALQRVLAGYHAVLNGHQTTVLPAELATAGVVLIAGCLGTTLIASLALAARY